MIQKKWNESKSSQYVAKFVHLFVFSMCSGYYCYITKHSNYSILFFSGISDRLNKSVLTWGLSNDCSKMKVQSPEGLSPGHLNGCQLSMSVGCGRQCQQWPLHMGWPPLQRGGFRQLNSLQGGSGFQHWYQKNKAELNHLFWPSVGSHNRATSATFYWLVISESGTSLLEYKMREEWKECQVICDHFLKLPEHVINFSNIAVFLLSWCVADKKL